MIICKTCSAALYGGFGTQRCQNGFIQGRHPVPTCMMEDGSGRAYWLFPPDQWEALRPTRPDAPGYNAPAEEEA